MKKHFFPIMCAFLVLLSSTAHAATRAAAVVPRISFNGTTASCNTTSGKLTIGGTLNSSGDENNKSRNAKIELYEVNKSGAIDSYTVSQFTESTSLSHTFRNLSANKNYYIRIVNTTGWGGPFTDLWLGGTVSISQ